MVIWIIHICTFDYIPSTLVFYVSLSISFYRADFFYCALFYPNLGAYKLPIFRTQSHTWRFVWRTFFLFLSSLNPKMRAALNCFITCNYRFKKKKTTKMPIQIIFSPAYQYQSLTVLPIWIDDYPFDNRHTKPFCISIINQINRQSI